MCVKLCFIRGGLEKEKNVSIIMLIYFVIILSSIRKYNFDEQKNYYFYPGIKKG